MIETVPLILPYFLDLKPLTWSQEITPNTTMLKTTCVPHADCELILSNKAKFRDFQIPMTIREGELTSDARQRSRLASDAMGGVWFVDTDFLHGWFFFKPQQFALVCNQVREAGHKGWGISLTVEPVQDDVWSVGKPLSIMSASIRFDSSPTNRNVRKSEP